MPSMIHRISIDAPRERAHQITATRLMSLKSGAEGQGFNAYPGGEISRWD